VGLSVKVLSFVVVRLANVSRLIMMYFHKMSFHGSINTRRTGFLSPKEQRHDTIRTVIVIVVVEAIFGPTRLLIALNILRVRLVLSPLEMKIVMIIQSTEVKNSNLGEDENGSNSSNCVLKIKYFSIWSNIIDSKNKFDNKTK
jgi:hypothetical protein